MMVEEIKYRWEIQYKDGGGIHEVTDVHVRLRGITDITFLLSGVGNRFQYNSRGDHEEAVLGIWTAGYLIIKKSVTEVYIRKVEVKNTTNKQ
jgi:hypothetical protein